MKLMLVKPKHSGFIGKVAYAFIYEPLTDNEIDKEAASRAWLSIWPGKIWLRY